MAAKKSPAASRNAKAGKGTRGAPAAKKSAAAPKSTKAPAAIKEVLGKTALAGYVAAHSGVDPREVKKVLAALETAVAASVSKKGAGGFVLPGLLKISVVKVPAKPRRKGLNRFTGQEQWFAAKPASLKVKIRPLKKLKDAAA